MNNPTTVTLTFPAHLLPLLVPDGSTLQDVWVVCFARRTVHIIAGTTAYGAVDAWHPFLPLPNERAATAWAEKYALAKLSPAKLDELEWVPLGEYGPGWELYANLDNGTEPPMDIAIVPLTHLTPDNEVQP